MSDAAVMEPDNREHLSVSEYLEREAASPFRHEFVGGVMHLMAGGSKRHNLVAGRVFVAMSGAASPAGCQAYMSDVRLQAGESYYYPDVMLTCEADVNGDDLNVTEPCVLVEVLSPSTAGIDRREKMAAYLSIPSLQQYLIIDHERNEVEVHVRAVEGRWTTHRVTGDASVEIRCVDLALPLATIFAQ
jgi:Uma2 family endonuclease